MEDRVRQWMDLGWKLREFYKNKGEFIARLDETDTAKEKDPSPPDESKAPAGGEIIQFPKRELPEGPQGV